MLPDLLGGEDQNRSHQAHQGVRNAVDGRLRRAAALAARSKCVEAIFQDVEVKRAQVHHAEIVQRMEHAVELKGVVPAAALLDQFGRALEHPAIKLVKLFMRQRVAREIKVGQVAEREAERVANLAVRSEEHTSELQ